MVNFWDLVKEVIAKSDVVLEVVDARLPVISRNKTAEEYVNKANKPLIIVLNKCDLISKMRAEEIKASMNEVCVFVSSTDFHGIRILREQILKDVGYNHERKIVVGIIGYPNVGKSSIINALSGGSGARVSSQAGHTRGIQHIKSSANMKLLDTPGVFPFEERDEFNSALIGAKNPSHMKDPQSIAERIIQMFLDEESKGLEDTYKVKIETDDAYEILNQIGEKLNYKQKGGVTDEQKTSVKIIDDWQRGKIRL